MQDQRPRRERPVLDERRSGFYTNVGRREFQHDRQHGGSVTRHVRLRGDRYSVTREFPRVQITTNASVFVLHRHRQQRARGKYGYNEVAFNITRLMSPYDCCCYRSGCFSFSPTGGFEGSGEEAEPPRRK